MARIKYSQLTLTEDAHYQANFDFNNTGVPTSDFVIYYKKGKKAFFEPKDPKPEYMRTSLWLKRWPTEVEQAKQYLDVADVNQMKQTVTALSNKINMDLLSEKQPIITLNFDDTANAKQNKLENTESLEETVPLEEDLFKSIVIDRDNRDFKLISGDFPDKKSLIDFYDDEFIVKRVFSKEVFDWIPKHAKTALDAYLLYSIAVSKWKNNNMLKDYYEQLIKDIPEADNLTESTCDFDNVLKKALGSKSKCD